MYLLLQWSIVGEECNHSCYNSCCRELHVRGRLSLPWILMLELVILEVGYRVALRKWDLRDGFVQELAQGLPSVLDAPLQVLPPFNAADSLDVIEMLLIISPILSWFRSNGVINKGSSMFSVQSLNQYNSV